MPNPSSPYLQALAKLILEAENDLSFNLLEVGALPIQGEMEPFHHLLELFPGTQIIAFEIDPALCKKLNQQASPGLSFYPIALGRHKEERTLYLTKGPACTSLYKPNEKLNNRYQNMDTATLTGTTTISTQDLDSFIAENSIDGIDFIKIDIQGAELDVFKGGTSTLKNVLTIISEVEFVHHYEKQPLFGDVSQFLSTQGLDFHKFLGYGVRSPKPIMLNDDLNYGSQYIWSDAVFLRSLELLDEISDKQLLKLAVLTFLYGSLDMTLYFLHQYDLRHQTKLMEHYREQWVAIKRSLKTRTED